MERLDVPVLVIRIGGGEVAASAVGCRLQTFQTVVAVGIGTGIAVLCPLLSGDVATTVVAQVLTEQAASLGGQPRTDVVASSKTSVARGKEKSSMEATMEDKSSLVFE